MEEKSSTVCQQLKLFVDFQRIPHENILIKQGFFAQDTTWKELIFFVF